MKMSAYIVGLSSDSGLPIFSRKKGTSETVSMLDILLLY